jgi:hypothetical protein
LLARCIGEEIQLDGAARLRFGFAHGGIVALAGAASGRGRFLEVPNITPSIWAHQELAAT